LGKEIQYDTDSVDDLMDGHGHTKPEEELSEIEKLKAENRLLKAEKRKRQMEIDLFKKLEETKKM